ncbi:MAG TPA: BrnT family toxin [Terriglobia bacterium]|nr:BrnT family toxin [Terriglobia bacterium]
MSGIRRRTKPTRRNTGSTSKPPNSSSRAARLTIIPFCVTFVERLTDAEQRWHAIGSIENIIVLVVVHTYREEHSDEVIRIISARPATRHERKLDVQVIGEEA